ncbi:MAG: glycosyltransferase family 2 protein [Cyclobacteriaceae bacterium]
MSIPLVSVCCITYNHENYIGDAVEGFLSQRTTFPVEVIIHDDASTDRTAGIIKKYANRYPEIVIPILQEVNQYSKGIKPSTTYVWPRAKGKYIALCEGDDFWTDPLKLQKQVDFLENNKDFVLSFHNTIGINEDKGYPEQIKMVNQLLQLPPEKVPVEHRTHTCSLFFRNIIKDFPKEYFEVVNSDTFLIFLLSRHGKRIYQNDIYPSVRRYHKTSVWASKGLEYKKKQKINTYSKMLEIAINDDERNRIKVNIIKEHIQIFQHQFSRFKIRSGFKNLFVTLKIAIKQKNLLLFCLYGLPGLYYLSRIPYKVYAKLKYYMSNSLTIKS